MADPHPRRSPVSLCFSHTGPALRSTQLPVLSPYVLLRVSLPLLKCQLIKCQLHYEGSPDPPNLIIISSSSGHLQHFLCMMKFNPFHHILGLFYPKLSPFPVDCLTLQIREFLIFCGSPPVLSTTPTHKMCIINTCRMKLNQYLLSDIESKL